jgi:hypothetical protein
MDSAADAMVSQHAAAGRLQSGATIRAALRIFEESTGRALARSLSEAAKLIEHRGRSWSSAMQGIEQALEDHLKSAPERLSKARRLADRQNSPSVTRAIDDHFAEIDARLRSQLAEFRDGWTSPIPKQWKDRHPVLFAGAIASFGALIGAAIKTLLDA